jgi:hypothetical protein
MHRRIMEGSRASASDQQLGARSRWPGVLTLGAVLVVFVGVLLPRQGPPPAPRSTTITHSPGVGAGGASVPHAYLPRGHSPAVLTPEEIVTGKVTRFAQDRLRITRAMAERFKVSVAPDVERFFEAVAAGRWEELNAAFKALKQRRESGSADDLRVLWGPILETLLIAECGHDWPAQALLDYGAATLGTLRPGMVYVGGTDPGRGIPTLLNETSDGERHIVITQNALADASYLQYVRFLYGDRLVTPTAEETQRAFQDYSSDAQQRLAHDQQFPDEPRQVRPGEDIRMVDNRVQVSGPVAVMAINENLLRVIMAGNPDLSFALEESYPLYSTYPGAGPLGPLMELGAQDVQNSFTRETAAQAVGYWRDAAQRFPSDAEGPADSPARLTYAKMAAAQAALLAAHGYGDDAEQAYRLALQISPASPEAVYGLGRLLVTTGRRDEARQLVADFERARPSRDEARVWRSLYSAVAGGQAAHP